MSKKKYVLEGKKSLPDNNHEFILCFLEIIYDRKDIKWECIINVQITTSNLINTFLHQESFCTI